MLSYLGNFNENQGDSNLLSSLHKNSLIPGNHWTEMNPNSAIFQVFQMCSIESELSIDWQVMVPLEHQLRLYSATESSITGITSVPKDGHFVPALITWHLK